MIKIIITLICVSFLIMYCMTPYYWENPFIKFYESFLLAKNHHWKGTVLFLGEYISAKSLPWYYIPIIIFITTPILYIGAFFIGLFNTLFRTYEKHKVYNIFLFCFIAMVIPPIATVVFNSTNLDGWRHYYFIYPFLTIFISAGVFYCYKNI